MSRFCYATDCHNKSKSPINRLDDYGKTILGKMEQINEIGKAVNTDYFLCGGDLLDKPIQTTKEVFDLFNILARRTKPTFAVIGNHPFKGEWESWKPKSGYHLLCMLLGKKWKVLDPMKGTFTINGVGVIMDHSDIVKKPVIWDHVLWEDYDAGDAKVVLISHYHPQQGVWVRDDGVTFISPGAISRGSLGEDNINRIPAVAVFDIEPDGVKNIELIDLEVEPGEKVLNVDTTLKTTDLPEMSAFDEIVDDLKTLQDLEAETLSPSQYIEILGKANNISKFTINYVIEKMREFE